jgi:DNA-binding response OmpR family regulator
MESLTDAQLVEQHIQASRPDAILLDISLVPGSGLDVCRRLKSDDRFKDIPILLLSGQTDPQTKAAGFEAGANDFIPKPFVTIELLARVRACLGQK